MENIIQILKKYNFSEMESKIYLTLLQQGNLTGYEVSKYSGVPRSKVYNVLEIMVKKNLIIVNKGEPKFYHAVSAEEFLYHLKKDVDLDMNLLNDRLTKIKQKDEESLLWRIEGYANVLDKVEHLIINARDSLFIQIWRENLTEDLLKVLRDAESRLNRYVLILFSNDQNYNIDLNRYYIHGFEQDKLIDFGSKWINIISDEKEVVFGTISESNNLSDVTWTRNKAMISLAKEYVKHDAYTLKIFEDFSQELKPKYGENLEGIRKIYK